MDFIQQIRGRMMSLLEELVRQDFGISGTGRWRRSDIHSSLVVDIEKDIFFFNARGLRGNAIDYLVKVRGIRQAEAENLIRQARQFGAQSIPKEHRIQFRYEKLVDIFNKGGQKHRDYWYRRCLTDKTIDSYKLGFYNDWYLIPIYDAGRFSNFQLRRDQPAKRINFWYRDVDFSNVVVNSDILKFVKVAYMTEGTVDCLLMNQMGFPTVTGANGTLSCNPLWFKYFTSINNIFYVADNDSAGIKAAHKVVDVLGSNRVRVFRFKDRAERYDTVDFVRDGGTKEELKELLETKSVYGFQKGDI